jgi:hypothetical protein
MADHESNSASSQNQDPYERYAQETNISAETLRTCTTIEDWVDHINLEDATTLQLCSYAGYTLAEIRSTSLQGRDFLESFQEDFVQWREHHFYRLNRAFRRELIAILSSKGIFSYDVKGNNGSLKLYNIVEGNCTVRDDTMRGTAGYPTLNPIMPPTPDRTKPAHPPQGSSYDNQKGKEPQLAAEEGPKTYSPAYTPAPRDTYLRSPAVPYAELPRQPGNVPSYYWQDPAAQPVHKPLHQNPYEVPPPQHTVNERLPPEKLIQFQKSWRKENNYTGKPYDILADKTRVFIDLCRRLDITDTQYTSIFPDILEGRASMYYMHNIGPGHDWKGLYEMLDHHFNTKVNHNQYWTDWTTMSYARCKQENPDKSSHEALEIMIDKLTLAQRALGRDFQGEVPLHTAVVRACRGQPELEQAMFSIQPTCEALFSDLRSALQVNMDRQAHQFQNAQPELYYTDRRYNSGPRTNSNLRPFLPSYRRSTSRGARRPFLRLPSSRPSKKCFVCHKEGCWSSNHPRTDLSRAKRQYVTAYEGFHEDTPTKDEVTSYIMDFEGTQSDTDANDDPYGDQSLDDNEDQDSDQAIQYLTTAAYMHRMTGEDIYSQESDCPAQQFLLDGRYRTTYQGELWDTGAARISTVGKHQLQAYLRENPRTKVDWTEGKTTISFGGQGSVPSKGTVRIDNPVGTVTYYVLDTPTPFLLCLADADRLGAYFNNVLNVIVRKDGTTVPVVRKWGHPFFNVSMQEAVSFFTEIELRRLHRRFGHPRTERLHTMLRAAGHEVDSSILEQIQKFCHFCQSYDKAPQRFKFSIKDDSHFNYEIVIDVVRINNRNVLHVIDADTSFQAAEFLKSMSARDTWNALCKCWINTYQGPPDNIVHDPGTNFASEDFRNRAKIVGTECKQMPVETHWAVGKIERAHGPLRRTFNILRAELNSSTDDEDILQMAVKALNDTAGPNGLVPTLLVFGTYPRINSDSPLSPDIVQRAEAVRKAMKMLRAERAKDNVNRAINTRNGPSTSDVLGLPLGSEIMVWREKGGWTGPYKLKGVEGQDITIDMENGPTTFRGTQAKPYYRADDSYEPEDPQPETEELTPVRIEPPQVRKRGRPRKNPEQPQPYTEDTTVRTEPPQRRGPGRPRKNPEQQQRDTEESTVQEEPPQARRPGRPRKAKERGTQAFLTEKEKGDLDLARQLRKDGIITTPGLPFEESDRTEMDALIANGTFEILKYNPEVHYGRIFNLRLVREIKGKNTQPYEKSRLVLAGHSDQGKEEILTQSPTIQRMSQRLLLSLGASLIATYDMHCELRDITQAYVQSKDKLLRTILAKPPKELQGTFPPGTILRVVRPLYGAAESGLYWFKTYHTHHKDKLKMKTSSYDPCLLITDEGQDTFGITGLQTDDTLSIVTASFARREQEELEAAQFRAKPKTILSEGNPVEFNGGKISITKGKISLTQKGQTAHLRTIDITARDAAHQYIVQRARGAYIASVCQPEAAFDLSTAAQTTAPEEDDFKNLNVRIQWQIDNPQRGLTFVPIELSKAKLFIFTDGSFANNKDLSSQLGFIIVLGTEHRTGEGHDFEIYGNIVHWNSVKCKRVTRSVLASELYGMVNGFDNTIAISTTLQQVVRTLSIPQIPVIVCSDSKSLYDCLVKLGTTNEKRLMIDIMSLRESYENREINEVRWINGKDNPADACTKRTPNSALEKLVSQNKLSIRVEACVDRATLRTKA